jgi:hypothetical protein
MGLNASLKTIGKYNADEGLIGSNNLPLVYYTAPELPLKPAKEQILVAKDTLYPTCGFLFWRQGGNTQGFIDTARGVVRPHIVRSFAGESTKGVVCNESRLVQAADSKYDPDTYWVQAMDFRAYLAEMQANSNWIRVDHLFARRFLDNQVHENADELALFAMQLFDLDVKNDKSLDPVNGSPIVRNWNQGRPAQGSSRKDGAKMLTSGEIDYAALYAYAAKESPLTTLKALAAEGVTFPSIALTMTPARQKALNTGDRETVDERNHIKRLLVEQYSHLNSIFNRLRAELKN